MNLRKAWRALWESKESAARRLIAMLRAGQPVFTPRDYARFSEEGFRKNVIAKRCIEQIARNAAGVPWLLYQKRRRRQVEIEEHEILDLIDRPNPLQGQAAFIESLVAFYLIAGNSYVEAVGPTSGPNAGKPRELWPLRPDRVKIVAGAGGMPAAYTYEVAGQKTTFAVIRDKSPVLHLKTFNPLDDWYGMSPLEAAAYSIDQHNEAGRWNMALLQHSGRPSGALVVTVTDLRPSGDLTDTQYDRLKDQIDEQISGGGNAGRPLLLEGGLDWKEMGLSPKDMDWLQGKDSSAREIAIALGYPALLLGIPGDNTYANHKEAHLALWEETEIPLLNFVRDELNNWLVPAWGEDLFLDYDRDSIEPLAEKRAALWDKVNLADFLSVNEKRRALGYEDDPAGDVILIPAGKMPLGAVTGEDITEE